MKFGDRFCSNYEHCQQAGSVHCIRLPTGMVIACRLQSTCKRKSERKNSNLIFFCRLIQIRTGAVLSAFLATRLSALCYWTSASPAIFLSILAEHNLGI